MHNSAPLQITIRPAVREDEPAIRVLVRSEHLNPLGFHWQNFLVVEDSAGALAAIGAVKTHGDGSRELASIATAPSARGRGAAGAVIREILAREESAEPGGGLYLTCRRPMKEFYVKFGFREIGIGEMPPYFRRLYRLVSFATKLAGRESQLTVMKRP